MPKFNKRIIGAEDMYLWYKSRYSIYVDYKTYRAVVLLWGDLFNEYLLDGRDVKLYSGLSKMGVRKQYKPTYIDPHLSKLAKKKVVVPNTHSEFWGARIWWNKAKVKLGAKGWKCKPNRKLSRALGTIMRTPGGHRKYVQILINRSMPYKKFKKRFKL